MVNIKIHKRDHPWDFMFYEYYPIPNSVVLHGFFKRNTYHFTLSGHYKRNINIGFWTEIWR